MTLAVTSLTSSSTAGASVASIVTASVSPAANSLLALWVSAYNGAGTQVFTVGGVSGLGLTWTRAKLATAGSASKGDVECWTAVCGASPGSGTITATFTSTFAGGAAWDVDQATGENASAPLVTANTVSANNSSTAPSAAFAAASGSQNLFLSGITALVGTGSSQTVTPNESPAWTQLANTASSTAGQNGVVICTQASPDATHLTTSAALGSSGSWGVIGLEIAAAAGTTYSGTAALAGSGAMASAGTKAFSAAASLSGAGTLASSGLKTVPGSAPLSGAGSLASSGSKAVPGTAAFGGGGILSGTGSRAVPGDAALSGSAVALMAASIARRALVQASGSGTLHATGSASSSQTVAGTAVLTARAALACSYLSARIVIDANIMFPANQLGTYGASEAETTVTVPGVTDGIYT